MKSALYHCAWITLCLLILLTLAWELWWAPARTGGSWLVLKALPLLAPLRGVLHGRRYTYQWSSMLILAYMTEGIVRGWSETGTSQILGWIECALAVGFFACALGAARLGGREQIPLKASRLPSAD